MKKAKVLKIILRLVAALVVIVLLLVVAVWLIFIYDKPLVTKFVEKQVNKQPGLSLKLGRLEYKLFPLEFFVPQASFSLETEYLKINGKIEGFRATGDLKKLYKSQKPAFSEINLANASINIVQKGISPEPVDFKTLIPLISDYLSYAQTTTVRASFLNISLIGLEITLKDIALNIAGAEAEKSFAVSFSSAKTEVNSSDKSLMASGLLRIGGYLLLDQTAAASLRVSWLEPEVYAAGLKEPFHHSVIKFKFDGIWETATGKINVSRFSIDLPELIEADGVLSANINDFSLNTFVVSKINDVEKLAQLVISYLPEDFRNTRLGGTLTSEARISSSRDGLIFEAGADFSRGRFSTSYADIPLAGNVEANFQARGSPTDFDTSGKISGTLNEVAVENFRLGPTSFNVQFDATPAKARFSRLNCRTENIILSLDEGKNISFDQAELNGRGSFDFNRNSGEIGELTFRLPLLPELKSSGWFSLSGKSSGVLNVAARGIEIVAIKPYLEPFIPPEYKDWNFDAKVDLAFQVKKTLSSSDLMEFSVTADLSEVAFNDPEFTVASEQLNPQLKLSGSFDHLRQGLLFNSRLTISQGESLFKRFYVDWAKNPITVDSKGQIMLEAGELENMQARIAMPGTGELNIKAAAHLKPDLTLASTASFTFESGSLLSFYSMAGAKQEKPLKLSGNIAGNFDISKNKEVLAASGKLFLNKIGMENVQSQMIAGDVMGEIPVKLAIRTFEKGTYDRAGQAYSDEENSEKGFIRIGQFSSPFLSLKDLTVTLLAGTNSYAFDPLALDLYGGRFELGRTTLSINPEKADFSGRSNLRLNGLDLAQLPASSSQFRISGQADIDFPSLNYSRDKIEIDGSGELQVFGGKVRLSNFLVLRPFSEDRLISLDIDLEDLDLKKVTDEIPFGEVTGILRGEIRGLTFSYGQPASFVLKLESVPRKGVPQTFSLKAVDNLTILSSGEQASMGTGQFWMRFIRGFRYEKLGLLSTLHNDTFTLNGTIKEGGVEYLVKKPAFFGINVINRMPDKKISFKEMMNRLSRVGRSEMSSGKKGG